MTYKQALLKRRAEAFVLYPLILLGRIYGKIFPLNKPTRLFLFYPSTDIGGSTKVNADIAACQHQQDPLIIFSKKPKNKGNEQLFKPFRQLELHKKIDNKFFHFVNVFYRGVLASWINAAENPIVLGGESLYFFKVIPFVRTSARIIEVCHLPTWFPYSVGFIDLIDCRIFSTPKLKAVVEAQYQENHLTESYFKKLHFIENKIEIPAFSEVNNQLLEVVFIGRGAPQKRVHLTAAIARRLFEKTVPVHFSFVGDVDNIIHPAEYPFCTFYGNIQNEETMQGIYKRSDVLILTSSYEGLPVVVMHMMAHGKAVISTAVNAIPDYIKHQINGLLITASSEAEIVNEGVNLLEWLVANPASLKKMGLVNRQLAIEKFSGDTFCAAYQELLNSPGV